MIKKQKEEPEEPNTSSIHIDMNWDTGKLEIHTDNMDSPVEIVGLLEMTKDLVLRGQPLGVNEVNPVDTTVHFLGGKGGQA